MRTILLILLLLIPLHSRAADQPTAREYFEMPFAKWLGLTYRQQVRGVKAVVALKQLGMCQQQIMGVVQCMQAAGTLPAWKDAIAGTLMKHCSFDWDEEQERGGEKGETPSGCAAPAAGT